MMHAYQNRSTTPEFPFGPQSGRRSGGLCNVKYGNSIGVCAGFPTEGFMEQLIAHGSEDMASVFAGLSCMS